MCSATHWTPSLSKRCAVRSLHRKHRVLCRCGSLLCGFLFIKRLRFSFHLRKNHRNIHNIFVDAFELASMRDNTSKSSIKFCIRWVCDVISFIAFCMNGSESSSIGRISRYPLMTVSGVRNSWDTFATVLTHFLAGTPRYVTGNQQQMLIAKGNPLVLLGLAGDCTSMGYL